MDKKYALKHEKEIKDAFWNKYPKINSDNYNITFSKKGKLIVVNKITRCQTIYTIGVRNSNEFLFHCNSDKSISFDQDCEECINDIVSHIKLLNDVTIEIFNEQWPFINVHPEVKNCTINKDICIIVNVCTDEKGIIVPINAKSYIENLDHKEEQFKGFLNKYKKYIKNYTNKNIPNYSRKKLKKIPLQPDKIIELIKSSAKSFNTLLSTYKNNELIFVMGASKFNKVKKIYEEAYYDSITYEYNQKSNCFLIKSIIETYYVDANTYEIAKVVKNKEIINSIKEEIKEFSKALPYYIFVLDKIKELEADKYNVIKMKKDDIEKISEKAKQTGACYNDVCFYFSYLNCLIPVTFSIPHLLERKDIAKMKKEANKAIKEMMRGVDKKIEEIKEKELNKCRRNRFLFQSFSAQMIYDFLAQESYSHSFSRIYDYLKSGKRDVYINDNAGKYLGVLKNYKKEEIHDTLRSMVHAGLIYEGTAKGTYGSFDVYRIEKNNEKKYELYFNDCIRNKREIFESLMEEEWVSRKEAEWILEEMIKGNIKDKDMINVLNIFKNHDFVLYDNDKIKDAFNNISDNIKMYIPFIVDEYSKNGAEQKLLKSIIK